MSEIRIAIVGATGRMGRYLIQATQQTKGILLGAVLTRRKSSLNNEDAGELAGIGKIGVTVTNNFLQVVNEFDVLIDFTSPEGTLEHLNFCRQHKKSMVIGTTGFNHDGQEAIRIAAKEISIVFSANFSIGMNLMINLIKQATKVMGHYADIDIIEAHHRHKIDAPSGTALLIGKTIANAMSWKLEEHIIFSHERYPGERQPNTIGYAIVRAGDIVGEHTVVFTDIGERVEITHKASSRLIFANGAMKAACWIKKRNFGLYDMNDVLNISTL